jgi:hypothetical protein
MQIERPMRGPAAGRLEAHTDEFVKDFTSAEHTQ